MAGSQQLHLRVLGLLDCLSVPALLPRFLASSRHLPSPVRCRQPTPTPAVDPTACYARRSLAETEALVDGVRLLGPSKWAEIKKLQVGVPGTDLPAGAKHMHAGLLCCALASCRIVAAATWVGHTASSPC